MWAKSVLLLALFAANSSNAKLADPDAILFKPTSKWVLDYADERCSLNQTFAASSQQLRLRLDSYGSKDFYRILLAGSAVPNTTAVTEKVMIQLTPDVKPLSYVTLNGHYDEDPAISFNMIFRPSVDVDWKHISPEESSKIAAAWRMPDTAFEQKTEGFVLKFWNGRTINVALGSMGEPLKTMRDCVDNLVQSWGLDPAQENLLSRRATPKVSAIKKMQQNYPVSMLLTGTNAFVPVRVMVDATGKATACVVQNPSAEADFKNAVCGVLSADYDPALSESGIPVPSVFQASVTYKIGSPLSSSFYLRPVSQR